MDWEAPLRLGSFVAVLGLMLLLETRFPRRPLTASKPRRLLANLGVVGVSTLLAWAIFPLLPVGAALWAQAKGFGLLHLVDLPLWAEVLLTIFILDFFIWLQHYAFHRIHLLWLLHRMHHADLDIDASTGIRFHPIEMLASLAYKVVLVALLGAPAVGVALFEVLLNSLAMFNHANLALPLGVDRMLRLFVVTPDMHRVHHSVNPREFNHNLGFNFPWWDRFFRTYTAQPEKGHLGMKIGLNIFRDPKYGRLDQILLIPFR